MSNHSECWLFRMKRIFWGICWVPLLMFMGEVYAQEIPQEVIRLVSVKNLEDAAIAWRGDSGLNIQIEVSDLNQALRILASGKADFALITDTLTPGQKALVSSTPGNMALTYPAGWEALLLLVHPSNKIPSISLSAAKTLFAASRCISSATPLQAWGDLPGSTGTLCSASIEVLMPQPGSHTEEVLSNLLLGDCQPRSDCQILTSDAATERCVAAHPKAIGIVSRLRYLPNARVVPVTTTRYEEEPPSLVREINLIARKRFPHSSPQAAFIRYVISEGGQTELKRLGLFSLQKD